MRRAFIIVATFVVVLFVGVSALAVRANLPVFWGMDADHIVAALESQEPIVLPGSALFISDFHLRIRDSDLRIDIPMHGVDSLVIVGDFFQSPDDFRWFAHETADTNEERVWEALQVFLPDAFTGPVYWISAINHEPQLEPFSFSRDGVDVTHLGLYARFVTDEHEVVALHGDEFFEGAPGGAFSWLAQRLGVQVPLERAARGRLELSEETWLVTAHSHVPGIHSGSRTANTGSFAGVPFNSILRVHVGTGVLFDGNDVELLKYEGIQPTFY